MRLYFVAALISICRPQLKSRSSCAVGHRCDMATWELSSSGRCRHAALRCWSSEPPPTTIPSGGAPYKNDGGAAPLGNQPACRVRRDFARFLPALTRPAPRSHPAACKLRVVGGHTDEGGGGVADSGQLRNSIHWGPVLPCMRDCGRAACRQRVVLSPKTRDDDDKLYRRRLTALMWRRRRADLQQSTLSPANL